MKQDGSRYKIAYFSSYLEGDEYNNTLWININEECKRYDIDLILFPGRNLRDNILNRNIFKELFNFFNENLFDGIIISSSSLINYIGEELFYDLIGKFKKIPIVSIGIKLDNASSVFVDNTKGMELITEHLINEHKYKNFLFIAGKKNHPESIRRVTSFQKCLEKHNIPFEDTDILYGDFTKESVRQIFHPEKIQNISELDAIVCANDSMSKEVIDILKENGFQIPRDIGVTGFDNSISANLQRPKITTVNQRVEQIAKNSLNLLIQQITGVETERFIVITPQLIINESCGCYFSHEKNIEINDELVIKYNLNEKVTSYLKNSESDTLLKEIRDILYNDYKDLSIITFRNTVSIFIRDFIEKLGDNNEIKKINNLHLQLIELFKDYETLKLVQNHVNFKEEFIETRMLYEKLLISEDLNSMYNNMNLVFQKSKINTYYILLYVDMVEKDKLKLVNATVESVQIDCIKNSYIFNTNDFLPKNLLPVTKRSTLISLPLFSLNQCFGYMVLDSDNINSSFLENIHINISSTLMNVLSLEKLKETKMLLVESEKLSYLGNLVAGLAHEMNTPIGITVTATSHNSDLLDKLKKNFMDGNISKNTLSDYINKTEEANNFIKKSLNSTITLINKFKLISTNTNFELKNVFNLVDRLKKNIDNRREELRSKGIIINFEAIDILLIDSYPTIFDKIINFLIENSIVHGFENNTDAEINIKLVKTENSIILTYGDNGKGCDEIQLKKIFDPFFTTKRSKGFTGLGLTIVYNLIKMKLKGEIESYSGKNQGLNFKITIPN